MTISRMTQMMTMERSYLNLQSGYGRLAQAQERLTTGRQINRPSDSPTDTTSAMRIRSSLADQHQYQRNAEDGLGWLAQIDTSLTSAIDQVRRARELGMQGNNAVTQGGQARDALAAEIDQLREGLLTLSNSTYLGRPVFAGIGGGNKAYDESGGYVGVEGTVERIVGNGVKVTVNVNGPDVFGAAGSSVFDDLAALSGALRSGDTAALKDQLTNLEAVQSRLTSVVTDVGTRTNRLEAAAQTAQDTSLALSTSLSNVENVDLTKAAIDVKMQEVAYQAALSATARLVQPSLADFLR